MTCVYFLRDPKTYTGNFAIDEDVVQSVGVKDLTPYACDPSKYIDLSVNIKDIYPKYPCLGWTSSHFLNKQL